MRLFSDLLQALKGEPLTPLGFLLRGPKLLSAVSSTPQQGCARRVNFVANPAYEKDTAGNT